jgi:hypothetical protein
LQEKNCHYRLVHCLSIIQLNLLFPARVASTFLNHKQLFAFKVELPFSNMMDVVAYVQEARTGILCFATALFLAWFINTEISERNTIVEALYRSLDPAAD